MPQRVPSWDMKDVNPNHHIFKPDYEVAELTWEKGQVALHELGSQRVPTKPQPTTEWVQPRATQTLEALVNQATLQPPYNKTTNAPVKDVVDDLVPWMHHHNPTVTSDALVPNKTDAGCSTHFSSCSGNPSVIMGAQVARGDNLGGQRLMSASTGSPENTSSGRDCSNSTFPDHTTASHRRTSQRETKTINEKGKSSTLNKRRRTAAIHNQSERTDKASMLDEVIEHIKQLHVQLHAVNMMNMSPMMMSLVMQQQQQQLQLQKSMMNTMGMGMGMGMGMTGMGMGMGGMDMNTIGASNINPARFHPSAFMQMPSWNNQITDQVNVNTPAAGPMPPFLASRPTPLNMESYSRMAALYQQMQSQSCGPYPKN